VRDGKWAAANPFKLNANFVDLGLLTTEEHTAALMHSLEEITPADYAGKHPPESSYEPVVKGADMFAFSWLSKSFGCRMYLKFCFVREEVYFFSLHEDRQQGDA